MHLTESAEVVVFVKKKKKKQLQVVAVSAPKNSENVHFYLLAAATDLKSQEQNHLVISQRCCENKFLQVVFSGARKDCLLATVKIHHFSPGSILVPPLPNPLRPSGSSALEHFLHPFYLPQEMKL